MLVKPDALLRTGLLLCALAVSAPALAATLADQVCVPSGTGWVVDKRLLASYLLAGTSFNAGAVPDAAPGRLAGLDLKRRIVADGTICRNNLACSPSDISSVRRFRGTLGALLSGSDPAFAPSTPNLNPEDFMLGGNGENALRCTRARSATTSIPMQPGATPGGTTTLGGAQGSSPAPGIQQTTSTANAEPTKPFYTNFRVRGKASDLYIDRSEEIFKTTSQFVASLASDGVSGKTTSALQGVIGYNIPTTFLASTSGESLSLIPYVGIDRVLTSVRPGKNGKSSANEIVSGGLLATAFFATGVEPPVGHRINIRSTFLSNLRDDTSIASLNFQYVPVIDGVLNSFLPIRIGGRPVAALRPILDARVDAGGYTNHGQASSRANNRDFVRLGGQVGGSLISDYPTLPIEFRSTYTGLYGAAGRRNIGLFDNTLNWSLDPDRFILLTVSYSNGNREDTAERQQQWLAGISVRY